MMGSYLDLNIGNLGSLVFARGGRLEREAFTKVMQEVLDSLPEEFRSRIRNVALLVEDFPPGQTASRHPKKLLLGLFHGVPMTKKSVFNLPTGPDYVVPTRRTSKRSAPQKPKSGIKSGARSSTSSGIISPWTKSN
jgi:Zincin-like metallopeptidase